MCVYIYIYRERDMYMHMYMYVYVCVGMCIYIYLSAGWQAGRLAGWQLETMTISQKIVV